MTRKYLGLLAMGLVAALAWSQDVSRPRAASPKAPETLRLLNQRLPDVRFDEQPFDQVLDWLAEFTQMNFVIRWQVLEDASLKRDTPISLQVRNLRLSQVLWLVMSEAGGSDLRLAYRVSGKLLVLSTEADLSKELVTKVYDVADLLLRAPSAGQPDYTQNQGLQAGGQGGSGSQSIFGTGQGQRQQDQQNLAADVQIQKLVTIIQDTIEPDSWERAQGVGRGRIQTFGNLLIVSNTILVHQMLGGYLTESEVVGP